MSQQHQAWWQDEAKHSDGLLSRKLLTLLDQDDPAFITKLCEEVFEKYQRDGYYRRHHGYQNKTFAWLWNLYLEQNPLAKKGLKKLLDHYSYQDFFDLVDYGYYYFYDFRSGFQYTFVPFKNDSIRYVKAIYKLAEARQDDEIWAILAYRFDAGRSNNYSKKTRHYLRRRTWRYLRRLGEQGSDDYVRFATKVLLHYREADASEQKFYHRPTGRTIRTFTRLWLFNHLIYHNSSRFSYPSSKYWQGKWSSSDVDELPREREEAFPEIWDRHPEQLFRLLTEARAEPVIQFAGRALRMGNPAYVRDLSEKQLHDLLNADQPARRMFAAGVLLDQLNPMQPDFAIWLPLMFSAYTEVRAEAKKYLHKHVDYWEAAQVGNIILACNQYLQQQEQIDPLFIDDLLELFEGPLQAKISQLATIDMAKLFLYSPAEKLQKFAAVPLSKIDFSKHPFIGKSLLPFLSSKHSEVQEASEQLLNKYDTKLDLDGGWLAEWICQSGEQNQSSIHAFLEARRLWVVPYLPELLTKLWVYLLRSDANEQAQMFILDCLFNDLFLAELKVTPLSKILGLLEHERTEYQEFAARLIRLTELDAKLLSFEQLLVMAHNRVVAVRVEARRLISEVPERITADWMYNLIETDWRDAREWMISYIRELPVEQISPELVYGLLDTARKDVQQFAMELVERHATNLDMKELMLRGSENPHLLVQEYVLTLAQKITWDEDTLKRMDLFFRIVLLRVNRGSHAKKTALSLLVQLGKQKLAFAQICVPILCDVARNQGVKDFEAILSHLTHLKIQFPELEMSIELLAPFETHE